MSDLMLKEDNKDMSDDDSDDSEEIKSFKRKRKKQHVTITKESPKSPCRNSQTWKCPACTCSNPVSSLHCSACEIATA
eukprot:UN20746